jgi:hypothetical protein
MTTIRVRRQAADLLRRLLAAINRGELSADTPVDRRITRRIEGALAALDADQATHTATGRRNGPRRPCR